MASGSLPAKIQTITLGSLVDAHYLQKFGREFTSKEFKANLLRLPLDKNDLQSYSKGGDKPFWIDLKKFKDELGLDYVLYLEIPSFGAKQSFYGGFFATGAPRGSTQVDVYLVETKTNNIVSEYHGKKEIDVNGKWDNPPDYPEMLEAVNKSFQSCLEEAALYFFEVK